MFDPLVIASGLFVGFVVGLTGMGGGALMTPILVMLFHIEPLAAVSSDIVAAMVMKPIGGAVHWRRGTVQRGLVTWLMLGSTPSAFLGVLLLRRLDAGIAVQAHIKVALGVALYPSRDAEASARGAALLALESLGLIQDVAAVEPHLDPPVQPDAARNAIYTRAAARQDALYQRLLGGPAV